MMVIYRHLKFLIIPVPLLSITHNFLEHFFIQE